MARAELLPGGRKSLPRRPRLHEVVHLALQFAACCGELRSLRDSGVDFSADISDAHWQLEVRVAALADQAHTPQHGMHVYEERKDSEQLEDKSSTLQLELKVPYNVVVSTCPYAHWQVRRTEMSTWRLRTWPRLLVVHTYH